MKAKYFNRFLSVILTLFVCVSPVWAQLKDHQKPGKGNPLIPGYFADPTVVKIGDTYYLYATTDGNGGGFGPSQVWTSKDFVNWTIQPMNWPNTHWYWAPDMVQGYDGRYYLYYSQPVQLYGAVSDSPVGPWSPLQAEGEAMVPNYLIPGVITLDGQVFTDDDGKKYMYWGTWGIYPDHGCAVGLLNEDMKTFKEIRLIPNTDAKDFFEAPFVFKRNGIYYFMYSSGHCEDHTYRVQYAMSKEGPMGPFYYPEAFNPILETNDDGTIHGPGHHSILQEGDNYFIVYHRHNNPHSGGGFHRQVAADKLEFDEKGYIVKLNPSHEGIGYLGTNTIPYEDRAFMAQVRSSSDYGPDFQAGFAVDNNNGTLWKCWDNMAPAWLEIDLGEIGPIRSVQTQFEYATWYYQYWIETSLDGKNWTMFADRRNNRRWASPMIDNGDVQARYVRIHLQDTQIPGMFKGIWNIRVYGEAPVGQAVFSGEQSPHTPLEPQGLLIDMDASKLVLGSAPRQISNTGVLGGEWLIEGSKTPHIDMIEGRQALVFEGTAGMRSTFGVPLSLSGNSSYTVAFWVFNPSIERHEPVLGWTAGTQALTRSVIGHGYDKASGAILHGGWPDVSYTGQIAAARWKHIAVTFDGYMERLYVDGTEIHAGNKMLFLNTADQFYLGFVPGDPHRFSGALSSLKVYDRALGTTEIRQLHEGRNTSHTLLWYGADALAYGPVSVWESQGVLGGQSTPVKAQARVQDVLGRIAVTGSSDLEIQTENLQSLWETEKNLTLVLDYMPSVAQGPLQAHRWHQLVWVKEQKNGKQVHIRGFVNGVEYANAGPLLLKFMDPATGRIRPGKGSIAGFGVYRGAWSQAKIMEYADLWEKGIRAGEILGKAGFEVSPRQIDQQNIFMKATEPEGEGIAYQFVNTENGWTGPWQTSAALLIENTGSGNLVLGQQYAFRVKDRFGNVSPLISPRIPGAKLKLLAERFNDPVWKLFGMTQNPTISVSSPSSQGSLQLLSSNGRWDGREGSGPFLAVELVGDFVLEAELEDLSGLTQRRGNPHESGIQVWFPDANGGTGKLLQNSVMTGWGIGNLVSIYDGRFRQQQNNGLGWNFHRHLQIQRVGVLFYLRSSADGIAWTELPGSPYRIDNTQLPGQTIRAGLYQASNEDKEGYSIFRSVRLYTYE